MSDEIKVSIIIPVYNGSQYLDECINSVIKQTYSNIEMLAIDDGSTDMSLEILKEYAEKDKRIIVIHQENAGSGRARNTGIEHATGEYVTFLDCDDYLELDCISVIVNRIRISFPDMLRFKHVTFGAIETKASDEPENFFSEGKEYVKYILKNHHGGAGSVSCKVYKRKVLVENNIKFGSYKTAEDGHFNTQALAFLRTVDILDYVGYYYRKEDYVEHSVNKFFNRPNFFESSIDVTKDRLKCLRDTLNYYEINDKESMDFYYAGEFESFMAVNDENAGYNKQFKRKIDCNNRILDGMISVEAIRRYGTGFRWKWLCWIISRKSGMGLWVWNITRAPYISCFFAVVIFPKNSVRGRLLRRCLRRG